MKNRQKYIRIATIAAFCLLLGITGIRFQQGVPENPIEEAEAASAMFTSAKDLLYDEDILSEIDNANISAGKTQEQIDEQEQKKDDNKSEEENDQSENQRNEKENQKDPKDDTAPGKVLDDGDTWDSSRFDLSKGPLDISQILDIKDHIPGDDEGGTLPDINPGTSEGTDEEGKIEKYFETSIIQGDILEDEDYTFTITHLKPELTVSGIAVSVNDEEKTYSGDTTGFEIKLAEGQNRILIEAVYFDGKNYITASKTYTIYYSKGDKVLIITNLHDHTTPQEEIDFTAYGMKGTKRLEATVKVNGREISGRNDSFTAKLEAGENKISVSAGGRTDRVTETYTVIYQADAFKITTTISDTVITNDTKQLMYQREEVIYRGESENYKFKVNLHKETGAEKIRQVKFEDKAIKAAADGYYHVNISQRHWKYIWIFYTDSDGNDQSYKYIIMLKRSAEATPEDKQPTIYAQVEIQDTIFNLENGMQFKNPDIITNITALSWNNEQLYYNNFSVRVNGMEIKQPVAQTDAWFGYNTYLTREGENTISVTVTDYDGYTATKTWKVYYEKGNVRVKFSMEATTVGLGYLIPPTYIEVPGGSSLTDIMRIALEQYGYTYQDSDGYYLASVGKKGICNGFSIDQELMELIIEDGMDEGSGFSPEPASMDSLGEFDFYRWSGWMYSYNGKYPGYGINACKPQDGAVIRFRYTLALGKDIGGFSAAAGSGYGASDRNYYKEW